VSRCHRASAAASGYGEVELIQSLLFAPIVALVLAAAAIPFARWLAWQLEWVAKPAQDLLHASPVPLLGGVVMVGAFAGVGWFVDAPTWLIVGALALCAVGLVDDVVSLTPLTKILCELPLATMVALWVKVPVFLPGRCSS